MELYILNRELERIGIVSEYNALIWTTNLWDHGKASLKCLPDPMFDDAAFLARSDTDEAMRIVRRHPVTSGAEPYLELEAVGATWMFEKRVNWWTHTFNNINLASAAATLTTDAQAAYAGVVRTIAGMLPLVDLTGSPRNITKQVSWGSVSDAVFEMCKEAGFGFGVRYGGGGLQPYIRRGVDRSASVVFSTEYFDVSGADVDINESAYANLAVVGGQGDLAARIVTQQRVDVESELAEMWVDAKDLSSESLTSAEYLVALKQRGSESLAAAPITRSFEATVTEDRYTFGVDYSLGDRVAYRALGYEGTDVLSEVTETFESGARTIDIALGKTAPTIRQLIAR